MPDPLPTPAPAGDTTLTVGQVARAAPGAACLVHIYPTGPSMGRRYPLADRPVVIGRTDDCDVRVDDTATSRRHAAVEPAAGGYAVADRGSTNGTYVNDERVGAESRPLHDGDYLRIGGCIYRFLSGGNLEAEYHEEIHRLTVTDGLTRAHNRRALDEFLDRETGRSRRYARPLSVVLFDLDHFKAVNDAHGHLCGDAVLRGLADRVRPHVRREDLLARYGGEEFALVLVETPHPVAISVAERVRAAVRGEPFRYDGVPVRATVSGGVATTCGEPGLGPAELLKLADDRLYAAKVAGRDRVVGEAEPDWARLTGLALGSGAETVRGG